MLASSIFIVANSLDRHPGYSFKVGDGDDGNDDDDDVDDHFERG